MEAEFEKSAREVTFELVDPLGRVVWQETRERRGTQLREEIKLPEMAEGVYVLRMTRAGETYLGRMIIR